MAADCGLRRLQRALDSKRDRNPARITG